MEKLSAAYGYPYVRAEHNGQLAEAVEKTLAMEGPVICEIIVSTDQNFEPKSSAKRLPDGTWFLRHWKIWHHSFQMRKWTRT